MAEPEALRLADALVELARVRKPGVATTLTAAATELRRLHSEVERLGVDARRWRFICEKLGETTLPCLLEHEFQCGYIADGKASIDAAVDALDQMKDTP